MEDFISQNAGLILIVSLWDMVWKGMALWKSAKKGQKIWFVFLFMSNTVGILPIIYLLTHREKSSNNNPNLG